MSITFNTYLKGLMGWVMLIATINCPAQNRDTSFTIHSAFAKEVKKYPFIRIADPALITGSVVHQNVNYTSSSKRQLHADIYRPKPDKKLYPAVVLIHGGGWKSGDKSQMSAIGKELSNHGYVAVAPEYRLSPEAAYPAAVNDLRDALSWMAGHHRLYSIDTSRIAVLGVSSGGQLAALLGTTNAAGAPKIKAVVDIDGILAFHHPESAEGQVASEWLGGDYQQNPQAWADASALTHAGRNAAPILFVNSQFPRFHAGREDFLTKIQPFNIYSEVHTIKDTPHTFWLFHPWFQPSMRYVLNFLNKIFRDEGSRF